MASARGVLYIHWGGGSNAEMQRSMASLRQHHPELPVHVHEFPATSNMLVKCRMFQVSPFETTLYLDNDTLVMGRMDWAFEAAERFGLACTLCENPWARRHVGLQDVGDMTEYQAGVMFFHRKAEAVFERWRALAPTVDSKTPIMAPNGVTYQDFDDQASLAMAIDQMRFNPCVLPLNYNFRLLWHPLIFGPIKIYHEHIPPPPPLLEFNRRQTIPGASVDAVFIQRGGSPGCAREAGVSG
jgi:hypothetical protein